MLDESDVSCPYCGEALTLLVDGSAGGQRYTEDCQVCCNPMTVTVRVNPDGAVTSVDTTREDE